MYRELTMMEVREVLRRFGAGHSQRRIGRETGIGRNTVAATWRPPPRVYGGRAKRLSEVEFNESSQSWALPRSW
jgi:hypothetical protein